MSSKKLLSFLNFCKRFFGNCCGICFTEEELNQAMTIFGMSCLNLDNLLRRDDGDKIIDLNFNNLFQDHNGTIIPNPNLSQFLATDQRTTNIRNYLESVAPVINLNTSLQDLVNSMTRKKLITVIEESKFDDVKNPNTRKSLDSESVGSVESLTFSNGIS